MNVMGTASLDGKHVKVTLGEPQFRTDYIFTFDELNQFIAALIEFSRRARHARTDLVTTVSVSEAPIPLDQMGGQHQRGPMAESTQTKIERWQRRVDEHRAELEAMHSPEGRQSLQSVIDSNERMIALIQRKAEKP